MHHRPRQPLDQSTATLAWSALSCLCPPSATRVAKGTWDDRATERGIEAHAFGEGSA